MDRLKQDPRPGYRFIFVKAYRHWRTKKLMVAPSGKAFRLEVKT